MYFNKLNCTNRIRLMNLWVSNVLDLCKRVFRPRSQQRETMVRFQNFLMLNDDFSISLLQTLLFIPNVGSRYFISSTGNSILDQLVNQSKANALSCMNLVVEMMSNERAKVEMKKSPFYLALPQVLPTIIVCLIGQMTNPDFNFTESMASQSVSGVLTQSLKFISLCGGMSEFYNTMSESKTSLLIEVILPMLHTS